MPRAKIQARTAPGMNSPEKAPKARIADQRACHNTALTITVRRLTMSAMAPAGSVKRKKGADAAVAIRESRKGEAPKSCINHVATTSCEETKVPDKRVANHKRQNTGFLSANQVELDFLPSRRQRYLRSATSVSSNPAAAGRDFPSGELIGFCRVDCCRGSALPEPALSRSIRSRSRGFRFSRSAWWTG